MGANESVFDAKVAESQAEFTPSVKKSNLNDLLRKQFEPLVHYCEPFVSEGLTIFAGRPKIGKTTFVRQLLLAISSGGTFLGNKCQAVDSLFLCLEESERLAARKFRLIADGIDASRIDIRFEWSRGADAIFDLRDYLTENPSTKFIAIDSFSRLRGIQTSNAQQFQQDYETMTALHAITKDYPLLSILVLHHTTKMKSTDPLDCISGTYGITAAVDSYGVIMKEGLKYRLHWGGRNWELECSDFELIRENGGWGIAGEWDHSLSGLTPVQQNVVNTLKDEGVISATGLARRMDMTKQAMNGHLKLLTSMGIINRVGNDYSTL